MDDLILHSGDPTLGSRGPKLDLTLRDLAVNGEWITGKVHVVASGFGKSLDDTVPFKTLNSVGTPPIDIMLGATVILTVILDTPTRICGVGTFDWGPIHLTSDRQCVDFETQQGDTPMAQPPGHFIKSHVVETRTTSPGTFEGDITQMVKNGEGNWEGQWHDGTNMHIRKMEIISLDLSLNTAIIKESGSNASDQYWDCQILGKDDQGRIIFEGDERGGGFHYVGHLYLPGVQLS